jgi:hypothetical protein
MTISPAGSPWVAHGRARVGRVAEVFPSASVSVCGQLLPHTDAYHVPTDELPWSP